MAGLAIAGIANLVGTLLPVILKAAGVGSGRNNRKIFLGGATTKVSNDLTTGLKDSHLLKKRNKLALNRKTEQVVNTITHDPAKATVVGSFTYAKISRYSSDIDIFEQLQVYNVGREEACDQIAEWIQGVCRKVRKTKGFWFSELKVGYDDRYLEPLKIGKTKTKTLEKNILHLLNKQLISEEDYEALKACLPFKKQADEERFVKIYRDYFLLRWNESEAITGKKTVHGRTFTLSECIGHEGVCKLDVITQIQLRFIETTTFWINKYQSPDGKVHYLNIPTDDTGSSTDLSLQTYLGDSIRDEVKALSNRASIAYNPLKVAKRLWSIASFNKDFDTLNKLVPLLSGDYSGLNQAKNDLATIKDLLKATPSQSGPSSLTQAIIRSLDEINNRVSNFADIEDLGDSFPRDMNQLIENITSMHRVEIIGTLQKWQDRFNEAIIKHSDRYMRQAGLIPVPAKLLE